MNLQPDSFECNFCSLYSILFPDFATALWPGDLHMQGQQYTDLQIISSLFVCFPISSVRYCLSEEDIRADKEGRKGGKDIWMRRFEISQVDWSAEGLGLTSIQLGLRREGEGKANPHIKKQRIWIASYILQ